MHKALLRIQMERDAKDYLGVIDTTLNYKSGKVEISGKGKVITVRASAQDAKSLLASINGALKQMRVVSNIDSELEWPN
ncbi:MAG: hypothetical protein QXF01_01285 [Candidatus Micrarchaeaceae archaeon]